MIYRREIKGKWMLIEDGVAHFEWDKDEGTMTGVIHILSNSCPTCWYWSSQQNMPCDKWIRLWAGEAKVSTSSDWWLKPIAILQGALLKQHHSQINYVLNHRQWQDYTCWGKPYMLWLFAIGIWKWPFQRRSQVPLALLLVRFLVTTDHTQLMGTLLYIIHFLIIA